MRFKKCNLCYPRILDEVNKEIEAQRSQGVKDEQMKGLLQKKQLLELGTSIPRTKRKKKK